jgi:hypothetical protein
LHIDADAGNWIALGSPIPLPSGSLPAVVGLQFSQGQVSGVIVSFGNILIVPDI